MAWDVELDQEFNVEFDDFPEDVQDAIAQKILLLEMFGPQLSRPHADTLKGSAFVNMKELRVPVGRQAWRVAYAFDARRRGHVLVAGDKQGMNEPRFYKSLIRVADARFKKYVG